MMLELDSPDVGQEFVKDIKESSGGRWRWTGQQPTVKILVLETDNIKLSADFTLWDQAFRQTGPVELSFAVNGKVLDTIRYTSPGDKHFEKPVPSGWLDADQEATVTMTIDRIYVDKDGTKYGFILTRIGFVQ